MDDYDLSKPIHGTGLRQGLISYGDAHFSLFLRKVFIKALGYTDDALSRPIVGIVNTYSSFNPCHANIPQLIEATKRGVQLAGGLAVDFPTISLHESFAAPTSMFLRNLMSMDTEEMIKAQPCDAVILIGGELPFLRPCFAPNFAPNCLWLLHIFYRSLLIDRLRQNNASAIDGRHFSQQTHPPSRHWPNDAGKPSR